MKRVCVGIELRPEGAEVTVLGRGGQPHVEAVRSIPREEENGWTGTVRAALDGVGAITWLGLSLPAEELVLRVLELPFADPDRIGEVIDYQMEQYLPGSAEEYVVAWEIVESGEERARVLAVASRRSTLRELTHALGAAGVKADWITVDVAALASLVPSGEVAAVLDLRERSGRMALVEAGALCCGRAFPLSADRFDETLLAEVRRTMATAAGTAPARLYFAGSQGTAGRKAFEQVTELPLEDLALPDTDEAESPAPVSLALARAWQAGEPSGYDLRRDEFAPKGRLDRILPALTGNALILCAVLAVLLWRQQTGLEALRLHTRKVQENQRALLRQMLPEASLADRQPAELDAMVRERQARMAEVLERRRHGARGSSLALWRRVQARLPASQNWHLIRLDVLDQNRLTLELAVAGLQHVSDLQKRLDSAPGLLAKTEGVDTRAGGRVTVRYQVAYDPEADDAE
jgi:hypothetical protein